MSKNKFLYSLSEYRKSFACFITASLFFAFHLFSKAVVIICPSLSYKATYITVRARDCHPSTPCTLSMLVCFLLPFFIPFPVWAEFRAKTVIGTLSAFCFPVLHKITALIFPVLFGFFFCVAQF